MTQSSKDIGTSKSTLRIPKRLIRILIVATLIYFIGFIYSIILIYIILIFN
jgi:hypothetical protein